MQNLHLVFFHVDTNTELVFPLTFECIKLSKAELLRRKIAIEELEKYIRTADGQSMDQSYGHYARIVASHFKELPDYRIIIFDDQAKKQFLNNKGYYYGGISVSYFLGDSSKRNFFSEMPELDFNGPLWEYIIEQLEVALLKLK